jgi:hypothetical protein
MSGELIHWGEKEMRCVPFQYGEAPYILRDAICLTQAHWDAITPEELSAMQQTRYENWLAALANSTDTVFDAPVE